MKRVTAYQATDGEVFTDKIVCKKHQHQLDIREGVEKIVNTQLEDDYDLNREEIADFIVENSDILLQVLLGKKVEVVSEEESDAAILEKGLYEVGEEAA